MFSSEVWHQTNKVMLQFVLCQDISNPPYNLDKVHHTDMRGHSDTNWAEEHQRWTIIWKERHKYVLIGQPILRKIEHMSHYMNWYQANSKIYLTQFATYLNIVVTSRLGLHMETEEYPP